VRATVDCSLRFIVCVSVSRCVQLQNGRLGAALATLVHDSMTRCAVCKPETLPCLYIFVVCLYLLLVYLWCVCVGVCVHVRVRVRGRVQQSRAEFRFFDGL
jgi:hypothetical protein